MGFDYVHLHCVCFLTPETTKTLSRKRAATQDLQVICAQRLGFYRRSSSVSHHLHTQTIKLIFAGVKIKRNFTACIFCKQ